MEGKNCERSTGERDVQYAEVRKAMRDGRITTIDGLFTYIEKSVVAGDMDMDLAEFNIKMDDPRKLSIADAQLLACLFAAPLNDMLHLIASKVQVIRNNRTQQEIRQDQEEFILHMRQLEVDLPALAADIKGRLNEFRCSDRFV